MSLHVRKLKGDVTFALLKAFNAFKKEVSLGVATAKVHADITSKPAGGDWREPANQSALGISSPVASDLPTSLTLLTELRAVYATHLADDLAHKVADTVNVIAAAVATDLATAQTAANELKADLNLHIASTTYHGVADATNAIAAANASDLATLITLLNEMRTDLPAHMALAFTSSSIKAVNV
jgi:hypothetical protein